jgi:hypothetical protein
MSDASPDDKLGRLRSLREEEAVLIAKLVAGTPFEGSLLPQISGARVRDMPDGGMGSIKFHKRSEKQRFGKAIAEGAFRDADGVPVSVTLNLDDSGDLFELDMFKADFSPLVRYPDLDDVEIIKRHGKVGYAPQ